MTMEHLINEFIQVKNIQPSNANDLLDFIQRRYIQGELSIVQYRNMFRELTARGAKKPNSLELI
ncbi:YppF family protein [Aneurinibacillus sp. Ricciae_BoGa-3]|uniref:YppF family protein n=1 Tax=Aneurinibacillus sp. Ricciae_BoGa-3 TaxID=3022697 RepID=UPI00233FC77A|nr:YppF family protein [Aneurinibacillus sp. Ricciae_BoGa-3]WCK53774.1 YppF family protein [Aneurinibacillus sp. Ricciae_BoGa-3]